MTTSEIKKLAHQKILEGKSIEQTFEEIRKVANKPDENIAQIIRFIPALELRKKYRGVQRIFLGIIGLIVVCCVLLGIQIHLAGQWSNWLVFSLFPVLNLATVPGIIKFDGRNYGFSGYFTAMGLLYLLGGLLMDEFFTPLILVLLGLCVVHVSLSFFLHFKFVYKYNIVKEKYTNKQGEDKLRNVIVFQ